MLYFIQTTHFVPIDYKKYHFKTIDDNTLISEIDNSIWKARDLYDLGWGREKGFCKVPIPSFEDLFNMAFTITNDSYQSQFNYWGSLSVLLDDYCNELVNRISFEYKKNKSFIIHNNITIKYVNDQLNISDNLISRLADKNIAECCKKWKDFFCTIN